MNIEKLAEIVHCVQAVYARNIGQNIAEWSACPSRVKNSCVQGVKYVLSEPTASPKAVHAVWVAEMIDLGWDYGPNKDEAHKKHPNIKPFERLALTEQAKCRIFINVIRALAPLVSQGEIRECCDAPVLHFGDVGRIEINAFDGDKGLDKFLDKVKGERKG